MSREQLSELQVHKLRQSIGVCLCSLFYKKRLSVMGITPKSIQTVNDICKLPLTTKQELRDNYPFGMSEMNDPGVLSNVKNRTVCTYGRIITW